MLIACNRILEYTKEVDFDKFCKSSMTMDAVTRNIEILEEAVKRVSEDVKKKYPEIEWRKIAGTRDKVIHFYFGIKLEIVWDIITARIPKLKEQLEKLIREENWEI